MRFRLFALLLLPTLTVVLLAMTIVNGQNAEYAAAQSASETASMAKVIARVDEALGVEALAGARVIDGTASWSEFVAVATETDFAVAELWRSADRGGDAALRSALMPVDAALALRSDVQSGLVSPLQLLDRYSQLRIELLDHLASRITQGTGAGTDPLRGLVAIIEARSGHLDERLQLELAITYETWAPGLFSGVATSIALQNDRISEASSVGVADLRESESGKRLNSFRDEVLLNQSPPEFGLEPYRQASDAWLVDLNGRIASAADRIDGELAAAESEARSERNSTFVLVSAALLAAGIFALALSYRIVHRLHIITDRARLFAAGLLAENTKPVGGRDEISALAGTFDDMVNQVRQRDEKLEIQAHTDDLTGISNRQTIMDYWADVSSSGDGTAAVCLIDLDKFKPINDEYGHHMGDHILRELSHRMVRFVERQGGMAGRIGGDEFLVVLVNVDGHEQAATNLGLALNEVITEPILGDGSSFELGASIGVNRSRPGVLHNQLLREADDAMYVAKGDEARNVVVSTADLRDALLAVRTAHDAVVNGLAAGQFEPWFQPIFAASGRLDGFEALARWKLPDGRFVGCGAFIGVLENERLLPQLDMAVFEAVCRQIVFWNSHGARVTSTGINFSADSIEHSDFAARIVDVLRRTGCPPEQLALEVTESVLMTDIETNARNLQRLRAIGMRIHVDDFGTGYSSLRYLRELPVDSVKLDRVFVDGIDQHASSQAIVRAVVGLANDLGISVVAEGVETAAEHQWLVECGVTQIQGFLLGRPMPAANASGLLQQQLQKRQQSPSTSTQPAQDTGASQLPQQTTRAA